MSESAKYPTIITNQLFDVVDRLSTTLSSDITADTTPIPVASTSGFEDEGFITIENEVIYYKGKGSGTLGATTCTRGYSGTAVAHVDGTQVKLSIVAATVNRINKEVIAIQTYAGTSGGSAGFINARYLGGSTEGQLSVKYLGGSTEGQLNVDKVDGKDATDLVQITGNQNVAGLKSFSNGAIVNVPQTYTPDAAGTATLDLSKGNRHNITMPAGNITIAISNATIHQIFEVAITQDGTGSRTVTWFTTIKWADGSAPTLTTTASKRDVFIFIVTGANTYDGFIAGQNI